MGADVLRYRGALAALLMLVSPPVFCRVILPIYDEKSMTSACEVGLESVKRGMVEMEALSPKAGSAAVFSIWNDFEIELEDVVEHAYLTSSVHTDAKTRAAAEACKLQYDKFSTELYQNEKLYRLLAALKPADLIDRQLKRDLLEKFEDGGVSLPSEKRERARQIFQKLELLRQEYERNVQENKARLDFTSEEMKGLPQSYVENAKKNEKGAYLLGFDYPDYLPFMANADDELARKRYYIAFTNRGTAKNLEAMKEIASLRKDLANLYGLPSYSRFATRRLMAKDPQTVRKFLDEVKAAVNVGEARELAEMRELKAKLTGKRIDEVKVNRWDVSYYQEKIRKARFNIDQEALRKYFPVQGAIDYILRVSSELYGLKFRRGYVPLWQEDVLYYDVLDGKTGKYRGGVYLDLYPRDGKYKHAAAFPVRGASRLAKRTPISVLVANFNREGLTQQEMETLLHEFGHILHGVMSTTRYVAHAGTNVERDFVEAPSQMFEEWGRRPEALALLRKVCSECPVMDKGLIKRLDEARKYGAGVHYSRQHHLASFDQAMTSKNPGDPLETWNRMEDASSLGHVEGTLGPSAFFPNINHYGARYYGYMWSEVMALDMLSVYGDNIMNPTVGRQFRSIILANGGQESAKSMVRRFLGREPNSGAFFAEITGKR